ncbi:MAG: hydrogenase maturation peptidase HycI [Candidatus Methanosuratus sp.]|nr:hydrogenase maturation peptidase HycI [Candidatus Methanosuratincola sp.]
MPFEEDLSKFLAGYKRLVIAGVGNRMRGDDAAGCSAARMLRRKLKRDVLVMDCGAVPENFTSEMKRFQPSHILFIDAVDMGLDPGEFRLIDGGELIERSLSTHKQSLRLLFAILREGIPGVKIKLLGIQPKTIDFGKGLSRPVRGGLRTIVDKIVGLSGG